MQVLKNKKSPLTCMTVEFISIISFQNIQNQISFSISVEM